MNRSFKRRLLFAAILFAAAVVLVEGTCFAVLTVLDLRAGMSLQKALDMRRAELAWAWGFRVYFSLYDPLTQIRHKPGSRYFGLSVNENGFIENGGGDEFLNSYPEKPPGLVRVVLLGGSSMAGYGVRDNGETIAAILEDDLNLAYCRAGRPFQVLNFGLAGGYSAMELATFMDQVIYLSPDAVVFLDGYNDVWNAVFEHRRSHVPHPVMNWFDYSYTTFAAMNGFPQKAWPRTRVFTWWSVVVARASRALFPPDLSVLYGRYPYYRLSGSVLAAHPYLENVTGNNLTACAAYCAVNGIPALFYLQPHPLSGRKVLTGEERAGIVEWFVRFREKSFDLSPADFARMFNPAYAALEGEYARLGEKFAPWPRVRFISLTGIFDKEKDSVYVDNLHTNARGNALLARRFMRDIAPLIAR